MEDSYILVVDDDPLFRAFCCEVLRARGYEVLALASSREALESTAERCPALVLANSYLPEASGVELLEAIQAQNPTVDVILMSPYGSIETAVRALKRGAADYLRKPFAAEDLAAAVENTFRRPRHDRRTDKLPSELHELSRSFASLEEPERVLAVGFEALLQVCRGSAGVCLVTSKGLRFMTLLHQRGFSPETGAALRDALVSRNVKQLLGLTGVETWGRLKLYRALGVEAAEGFAEATAVPLFLGGELAGVFFLLRSNAAGRVTREELDHARFMALQIELAYQSALRLREAKNLALTDPLTELYNARYLNIALESRITEADRLNIPFSVLFLDLDYFKEINDTYGHLTGGQVLVEVSRILRVNAREEDTVVRFGGDEFTVVLPGTESEGAWEAAERIRKAIRDHVFLAREGKFIRLTACIGVATYPTDARSCQELIEQADRAMYRGKETARDVVYVARTH
jgi:two-component system, cell cycle response regulator